MATLTTRHATSITLLGRTRRVQRAAWRSLFRLALVFAVLLVAVDGLVSTGVESLIRADPQRNGSNPAWRLALYHAASPPDVLLLGSSRVQTGLNPTLLREAAASVLGRAPNILDLGVVWGTAQVNYWLLKNAITADKQPSLIIYGASEYEFNAHSSFARDYDAEDLATLADYGQAYPDLTQNLDHQLSFLVGRAWPLFRYRSVLHDTLADLLNSGGRPIPAAEDPYGFLSVDHVMTDRDIRNTVPHFTGPQGFYRDYTLGGYQAERFAEFLQLAQARGIRVVVINTPITTGQEALLPPGAYASYRAYLQRTCAAYGVPFVDYGDHTLWQEPQDFLDPHHLNRFGAAKLSPLVARDVLLPVLQAQGWK